MGGPEIHMLSFICGGCVNPPRNTYFAKAFLGIGRELQDRSAAARHALQEVLAQHAARDDEQGRQVRVQKGHFQRNSHSSGTISQL